MASLLNWQHIAWVEIFLSTRGSCLVLPHCQPVHPVPFSRRSSGDAADFCLSWTHGKELHGLCLVRLPNRVLEVVISVLHTALQRAGQDPALLPKTIRTNQTAFRVDELLEQAQLDIAQLSGTEKLSSQDAFMFALAILENHRLLDLQLSGTNLGNAGLNLVAMALEMRADKGLKPLRSINVNGNHVTDKQVSDRFLKAVQKQHVADGQMDFKVCAISFIQSDAVVSPGVRHMDTEPHDTFAFAGPQIAEVEDLKGQMLETPAMHVLHWKVKFFPSLANRLKEIYLQGNNLDDTAMQPLAAALKVLRGLRELDVNGNPGEWPCWNLPPQHWCSHL